ncbi:MAG: aldehyde dehydrogenase family protein [Myxococcales bacterium]|jgi:acyl-CoA reductase-like NAD-dependent aldehyde dehydrogenase
MGSYSMWIDGRAEAGADRFDVINPATEEVFAQAPECGVQQLQQAVDAAVRAQRAWRRDLESRRTALRNAAELLQSEARRIGELLTREQGKPLAHATGEIAGAAAQLHMTAGLPIPDEVTRDDEGGHIEVTHRPYGVVAAITPWNYPILIAVSKIAPALLAGNTMVLKPSPYTPLSTLELGAVLGRALPKGVLNVISGGNDLGAQLTGHPAVKKISFTGSVATGRKVAMTAGADLKRVTLELGGNDPAIVLDDVDPEAIAPSIFWSSFMNSGQICTAVKRVYAPESLVEAVTEAVSRFARGVKVGDGMDPETQLGPINNAMQLERVCELVADAKQQGAVVHTGGERMGRKGYFFEPTILGGVDDDVRIVSEEQFGPVLPIVAYRSLEDAIERANATHFGLGASVWGKDAARARGVATEIDAGTVWINQHLALTSKAPFSGAKCSGIGQAGGRWGVESFMQKHVINEKRG